MPSTVCSTFQKNSLHQLFFHPLSHSNICKKVAAVALYVFLTVLTALVWQIPFWIVNLLDKRRITLIDTPGVSVISSKAQGALPIEKSGRIRHGENTCFIAAAVQIFRQSPPVQQALKSDLTQKEEESTEEFQLRKDLQEALRHIFGESDRGKEVKAGEMEALHKLLHDYSFYDKLNKISSPGETGSYESALGLLHKALGVEFYNTFDWPDRLKPGVFPENEYNKSIKEWASIIHFSIGGRKHSSNPEGQRIFDNPENPNESIRYRLVGSVCYDGGHAIAYLKDLTHPSNQWISCDDLRSLKKVNKIHHSWATTSQAFYYFKEIIPKIS